MAKNKKRRQKVSDSQISQAMLGFMGLFAIMGAAYYFGGTKG